MIRRIALTLLAISWLLAPGCQPTAPTVVPAAPKGIYQVSTIQALMEGAYDGQVTCKELLTHGNLGIGTFDKLDGEMIVLDGVAYQVHASGQVRKPGGEITTPFAAVTPFAPSRVLCLKGPLNMESLQRQLDAGLPSLNLFYAIRIDGQFETVKTRSVPAQQPPYPRLADVARQQAVFEFTKIRGTILGLRCPDYAKGFNVPGWHLHFISDDRKAGGHLLDFASLDLQAQLAILRDIEVTLPTSGKFVSADLGKDTSRELHQVEKGK